ncbi:MAG: hypothetical protein HC800_03500 [Phormidesmis sp. RL_2_1]|nr:hypothetical protein [Phormidesmis sp. RL_2_1]
MADASGAHRLGAISRLRWDDIYWDDIYWDDIYSLIWLIDFDKDYVNIVVLKTVLPPNHRCLTGYPVNIELTWDMETRQY